MFQRKEEGLNSNGASAPVGETVVGHSVKLEGDFCSDENVRIDGSVSGTVKTNKNLIIGEQASVEADVFADNATIAGRVNGNIDVKTKLELLETARVAGDIKASVLSITAGAIFSGQCSMSTEQGEVVDAVKSENK